MPFPTDGRLTMKITDAGDDLNGGGFYRGGSGTEKTMSAPVIRTDLVLGAGGTTVTSATIPFDASDVNNLINIVSGVGFTPRRYLITAVAAGVATLSSSAGTAGSSGGVGRVGGQMRTLGLCAAALAAMSAEQTTVWLTGTQTISTETTNVANGIPVFPSGCQIYGYHATEGDSVLSSTMLPFVNKTTGSLSHPMQFSGGLSNLLSTVRGIRFGATGGRVWSGNPVIANDCWFQGPEFVASGGTYSNCRMQLTGWAYFQNAGAHISNSVIIASNADLTGQITNCLFILSNAMVGGDQYRTLNAANCTIVSPGVNYTLGATNIKAVSFTNCLFYSTNSVGSVNGAADYPANIRMLNCAYNVAPTNTCNKAGVLYSGNPFVDSAGNNYALSDSMRSLIAGTVSLPGLPTTTQPNTIGSVWLPAGGGGAPMIGSRIGKAA